MRVAARVVGGGGGDAALVEGAGDARGAGSGEPLGEDPPEAAEQNKAWGDWISRVGPALVDVGAPLGERTAVVDDSSTTTPSDQNGYSIVDADSLEAAKALVKDHPFLSEGKGRFSIEIFELAPMPM